MRRSVNKLSYAQHVTLCATYLLTPSLLLATLLLAVVPAKMRYFGYVMYATTICITFLVARLLITRINQPLSTMTSLFDALKEGDYSLRGVCPNVPLAYDINSLASVLQEQRVRNEEAIHLLTKILAALDNCVFLFDHRDALRLVNIAGLRLLGGTASEVFGRTASDIGLTAFWSARDGQTVLFTTGSKRCRYQVRTTAVRFDGRLGRLLVISDITDVLRLEEHQSWKNLVRVLSHEARNSLGPIQSIANTLLSMIRDNSLNSDLTGDVTSSLELIEDRAASLIRFLDGYSKVAHLPDPVRRRLNFTKLVCDCASLETRVPVGIATGEAAYVFADADQLKQAIINLIRNAAEAAHETNGCVYIQICASDKTVTVDIEDDGVGLPASENLFVPFFTTKSGGSGIGLVLARQIVEQHEGSLTLEARESGRGARAQVVLPISSDAAAAEDS